MTDIRRMIDLKKNGRSAKPDAETLAKLRDKDEWFFYPNARHEDWGVTLDFSFSGMTELGFHLAISAYLFVDYMEDQVEAGYYAREYAINGEVEPLEVQSDNWEKFIDGIIRCLDEA